MNKQSRVFALLLVGVLSILTMLPSNTLAADPMVQWINHLGFISDSPDVTAAFDPTLGGVNVTASAAGEYKIIQGLQAPPGYLISGVRICYALTDVGSNISQVGISQLQDPAASMPVLLDDNDLISTEPVCADIVLPPDSVINPSLGPLSLALQMNFGAPPQSIFLNGVGLIVALDPDFPVFEALLNHTHEYLTGKGVGHNNVVATTGGAVFPEATPVTVVPEATSAADVSSVPPQNASNKKPKKNK